MARRTQKRNTQIIDLYEKRELRYINKYNVISNQALFLNGNKLPVDDRQADKKISQSSKNRTVTSVNSPMRGVLSPKTASGIMKQLLNPLSART